MSKRALAPVIGLSRLIGLTFAVIAPASSVFLTFGTAFSAAGSGIVLGYLAGALLNVAVMLGYAEVGSRYPEAGGDYSLAARSLGRRTGSLFTVLFLVKGMAIPALLALSTATYAHQLWQGLPITPAAMGIFLVYVGLASLDIRTSSTVVTAMVAIEFGVFVLFMAAGLHHLQQPLGVLWHPLKAGPDGSLHRVAPKAWLAATVAALYGLNGPQASLYYSEEASADRRQLGRAILGAALATIAVELGGVIIGTLALPSLHLAHHALPLAAMVEASLGTAWGTRLLMLGITVALFDTGLATLMSYGRIFYAIARDRQWPDPINRIANRVSRRGIPIGALLFLAAVNLAVLAASGVHFLVTLGGSLLIIVYGGVAIASLTTRLKAERAPYQMPFWPWPPLVALAGLGLVAVQMGRPAQIVTALIVVLGLLWSGLAPQEG